MERLRLMAWMAGALVVPSSLFAQGSAPSVITSLTQIRVDYRYWFAGIAADEAGNVIVTGTILENRGEYPNYAFAAKMNREGTRLAYLRTIGSTCVTARSIAVDGGGNAYVAGTACERGLTTTPGALQIRGAGGIFVTKLDPAGAIVFTAYIGAAGEPQVGGIAVDRVGNTYVTGSAGPNFPVVNGLPWGVAGTGDGNDTFVAKLNPTGSELVYATLLGGSGWDEGKGIAVDGSGAVRVIGNTYSANFPNTGGDYPGNRVFVTGLNATGSAVVYSHVFRGSAGGIAADREGNTYVTGWTNSPEHPVVNAVQPSIAGSAVFLSNDRGASWRYRSNGLASSYVDAIAVDPTNSAVLYALGEGIFKSVDGGANWKKVAPAVSVSTFFPRSSVQVHPLNASIVYATGVLNGAGRLSVLKSIDGGETWMMLGGFRGEPTAIALHPRDTAVLYAGTSNGIFKSGDGGESWSAMNNGLPEDVRSFALAIDPDNPATVYATFMNSGQAQLYKTIDGGQQWQLSTKLSWDLPASVVTVDPANPADVYVGGSGDGPGFAKSTDRGNTWVRTYLPSIMRSLAFDPADRARLYSALEVASWNLDGGLYQSVDHGSTWRRVPVGKGDPPIVNSVAVDLRENIYIGAAANPDAYVVKLDANGAVVYSTYLGGAGAEVLTDIAVDGAGNAYISGTTHSADFPGVDPTTVRAVGRSRYGQFFLAKLNAAGTAVERSTLLDAGTSEGTMTRIAVDAGGTAHVLNAADGSIARVAEEMYTAPFLRSNGIGNAASFLIPELPAAAPSVAPGTIVSLYGVNLAGGTATAAAVPLPTALLDTSVTFDNVPAQLYLVTPGEIRAVAPEGLTGTAMVQVRRGAAVSDRVPVQIVDAAPGIFRVEGSWMATITHEDGGRLVSPDDPARPGETVTVYCTGLGRAQAVAPFPLRETQIKPLVRFYVFGAGPYSDIPVSFAGPVAGWPGLYQVNVTLPGNAAYYSAIEIVANGAVSNRAPLPAQ